MGSGEDILWLGIIIQLQVHIIVVGPSSGSAHYRSLTSCSFFVPQPDKILYKSIRGNVSVGHDILGHEPNPSLNCGFDKSCPRSAQLDVILHSLARNSKRLPKIESCDDKTPTYGSGNFVFR